MLLTKKQENFLFRKLHRGDIAARNELVMANLSLVDWVARNYVNNNKNLSLVQLKELGMTGLNKAIEKYDPRKSYKFSTYATWWFRQAIHLALGIKDKDDE